MQSASTTPSFPANQYVGLTEEEWDEMVALKEAISLLPSSVHPRKMERFTELLIKSKSWWAQG